MVFIEANKKQFFWSWESGFKQNCFYFWFLYFFWRFGDCFTSLEVTRWCCLLLKPWALPAIWMIVFAIWSVIIIFCGVTTSASIWWRVALSVCVFQGLFLFVRRKKHTFFLQEKHFFSLSLNFFNIMLEIRLRFS